MTTVLLLEAGGPESGAIAATAAAAGYRVHAATTPEQHPGYSPDLLALLSGCLLTDFSRLEHARDEIIGYARRVSADAVLSTNEYLTPLLAQVCAELGLPGNDPALAAAARNKADMADRFARHRVTAPATVVVDHEDELLTRCAEGMVFPRVIKPADGAGSAGVTLVNSADEALTAFRTATERRGMYGMPRDPRVLVQESVDGAEYSVESITQGGVSTHLCLTRKTVTAGARRAELSHGLPAALPADIEATVYREVDRAIAAVGIRNGASHTELIITPGGRCAVIEIGARLGAGQIGFLIAHALGVDPWAACLDVALGHPATLARTRDDYATVRFLTSPRTGTLKAVTGLPHHDPQVPIIRVRAQPGDPVTGAGDNTARLGSFVVVGPDQHRVDRHADHLLAQVRVEIEPAGQASNHTQHR
ncbi:MAG: ATP-grasp domain-containing protein [Pseudonocardiales bacterium]